MATQIKSQIEMNKQAAAEKRFTTGTVTSKDGTVIAYRQLGHGPAVIALHGAMESAASHMLLAESLALGRDIEVTGSSSGLAVDFTVYLPERRGHNLPGPFRSDYAMQQEVDDVEALIEKTGAQAIFGVSSGGLIALEAALRLPAIRKVAVYEPALVVDGAISTGFLPRYDREIAEGRISAALVSGMLGGQLGPAFFSRIPRPLMEWMTSSSMKAEDKTAGPDDFTMRRLAPTLHYDFTLVAEEAEQVEKFSAIPAEVLLLGGTASPGWLLKALDALQKTLPNARRIAFPGLNHGGSSDPSPTNRGGDPALVGQECAKFFA